MTALNSKTLTAILILFSLNSNALVSDRVQQVCGLSDTVYNYILETAGEKSITQHPLSATIGSARRLIIYKDQSWILTLEFLSPGKTEEDRTCIIAKGDLSTQELATDIMKRSEWIGPTIPQAQPPAEQKDTKPQESLLGIGV